MKTITFPSGVHLVALKDTTSPTDFLAAFQYENRHLEYINPSISFMRELDVSKDCCPVVLLPFRREDCERLIDELNRIAFNNSATIFVFISNPPEFLYGVQKSFTSIVTFDKSTNGGIVVRGAGNMHDGPYTLDPLSNAMEEALKEPPSDDSAYDETPSPKPTETATKISDLVKSRGFHRLTISPQDADAIVRQQRKDIVLSAERNVQKGDYIVFMVGECKSYHINSMVFEVSFVSAIPHSTLSNGYSQVSISFNRLANAEFHEGDISGDFLQDTIITTTPTTP